MPRVLTICPNTGAVKATHAVMSRSQFHRLKEPLMYWCSACRAAHEAQRKGLWLEGDPQPPLEPAAMTAPDEREIPLTAAPSQDPPPPPPAPALVRQALNGSGGASTVKGAHHNRRDPPAGPDEAFQERETSDATRRRDPATRAPGP